MEKTKTLKVRIKDKHIVQLKAQAKAVNFVWNYINDLSLRNIKERQKFLRPRLQIGKNLRLRSYG